MSNSYSNSPSSERRATDYENVELPYRSPSRGSPSRVSPSRGSPSRVSPSRGSPSRGSPSSLRSRNAYEILPPHVLHAPIEPGSPKPDAQGRIRPPIPKPYREKREYVADAQNNAIANSRGMFYNKLYFHRVIGFTQRNFRKIYDIERLS
jgi:hypothetical protein